MNTYEQAVALSQRYLTGLIGHDEFHRELTKVLGKQAAHAEWTWLAVAIDQYAALVSKPHPFGG